MDVVVKWPGSVHDARIFQNSSLNKMVKDDTVLPCVKVIVSNRNPVPFFFWLGNLAYPLLPYVMEEFSGGAKNDREKFFSFKLCSARVVIENA